MILIFIFIYCVRNDTVRVGIVFNLTKSTKLLISTKHFYQIKYKNIPYLLIQRLIIDINILVNICWL